MFLLRFSKKKNRNEKGVIVNIWHFPSPFDNHKNFRKEYVASVQRANFPQIACAISGKNR